MPLFHWEAMDTSGVESSGQMNARDEDDLHDRIRKRGLFLINVKEINPKGSWWQRLFGKGKKENPTKSNVPADSEPDEGFSDEEKEILESMRESFANVDNEFDLTDADVVKKVTQLASLSGPGATAPDLGPDPTAPPEPSYPTNPSTSPKKGLLGRMAGFLFPGVGSKIRGMGAPQATQKQLQEAQHNLDMATEQQRLAPMLVRDHLRKVEIAEDNLDEATSPEEQDQAEIALGKANLKLSRAQHQANVRGPQQVAEAQEKLAKMQEGPSATEHLEAFAEKTKGTKTGDMAKQVATLGRAMEGDPTAIAQLVTQQIDNMKEGIGDLFKAAKAEKTGDVASSFFEGAQKIIPGGTFTGTPQNLLTSFGKALGDSLEGLRNWNKEIYESNIRLAKFSPSMASVEAQQEMRDIFLTLERGERRAKYADEHAESKHKLERALAPIEDLWANLKANLLTQFNNWASGYIEAITKALGITNAEEEQARESYAEGYANKWMYSAGRDWAEFYRRPGRFPRDD